jgi:YesN/AraC family two-component response regulator
MTGVLEILIRNIKKSSYSEVSSTNSDDRIKMLTYINENIHKPEHLKVAHLASIFMMSPTYVSEFLKKFTCLCENTFLSED